MRLARAVGALTALLCASPVAAATTAATAAPERVVSCAECGMKAKIDNRFTSQVLQGGSTLYFCDAGDLVAYLARTQPKEYTASVHDFKSGEWLDARSAFFVIDKKIFSTPMGWGVAAFRDRAEATGAPLDFEALRKALR